MYACFEWEQALPIIRNSRSCRDVCSLLCIALIVLFLERKIVVSHFWISKASYQTAVSIFRALISGIPVYPYNHSAFILIWFPPSGVPAAVSSYKCGIRPRFMNEYYKNSILESSRVLSCVSEAVPCSRWYFLIANYSDRCRTATFLLWMRIMHATAQRLLMWSLPPNSMNSNDRREFPFKFS